MTRLALFCLPVVLLLSGPAPAAEPLLSLPAEGSTVHETVVAPGGQVATVIERQGRSALFVGSRHRATWDHIEQVAFRADGGLVYWARDGEDHYVVDNTTELGPYDRVYLPDLETLDQFGRPTPGEWGYLGGRRMAFAGRDPSGHWGAVLRYPGANQNQERRPLPVTVATVVTVNPNTIEHRPLHFLLVRGRVPLFIGVRGNKECLMLGEQTLACARQVVMFAYAAETGRFAFAVGDPQGMMVHTGHRWHGPTPNVDWVGFSPAGHRFAFVARDGSDHLLIVDDREVARGILVEAVAWTPDERCVAVVHSEEGSRLLVEGETLLEKPLISALYLGPDGRLLAGGKGREGPFLDPLGRPGDFNSLWGEGFLTTGPFFALARLPGGQRGLLFDGKLEHRFSGIGKVATSPDGAHLAVVGAGVDNDTVVLDGRPFAGLAGKVDRLGWCGSDQLLVWERQADRECLVTGPAERQCCPRLVVAGCRADGSSHGVCVNQGLYQPWNGQAADPLPYDDVPLSLVYQDTESGQLDYAGRRGKVWYLVLDGRPQLAEGTPLRVLPGADAAWFEVRTEKGRRWVTRTHDGAVYDAVYPPHFLAGRALYLARREGRERWVTTAGTTPWVAHIVSPPILLPDGFAFWTLEGDRLTLEKVAWQDGLPGENP